MKNFATIGLIFTLLLLTPALVSAQPGPVGDPPCDCDYCYDYPILSCNGGSLGIGSCALFYYLFCEPWHEPGNSLTGESQGDRQAHTWRSPTVADFLLASAPGGE